MRCGKQGWWEFQVLWREGEAGRGVSGMPGSGMLLRNVCGGAWFRRGRGVRERELATEAAMVVVR